VLAPRAEDRVWALVSGLPSSKRGKRLLMVFQVFIDDSGSEPQSPIFVLAGFIASHDNWARFADDWQTELDRYPKLDYFKMSEAGWLRGQFSTERGWTESLRDNRVMDFANIVLKHAAIRVETTMRHDDFAHYLSSIPAVRRSLYIDHPYSMLLFQAIMTVAAHQDRFGIIEPCDFVFDEQTGFSDEVNRVWSRFKASLDKSTTSDLAKFVGSRPIFRSEMEFLPLQAVDLCAWQLRNHYVENHRIENQTIAIPPNRVFAALRRMPSIYRHYDERQFKRLNARLLKIGERFKETNPDTTLLTLSSNRAERRKARRKARKNG
jgi:hypothetical protein